LRGREKNHLLYRKGGGGKEESNKEAAFRCENGEENYSGRQVCSNLLEVRWQGGEWLKGGTNHHRRKKEARGTATVRRESENGKIRSLEKRNGGRHLEKGGPVERRKVRKVKKGMIYTITTQGEGISGTGKNGEFGI